MQEGDGLLGHSKLLFRKIVLTRVSFINPHPKQSACQRGIPTGGMEGWTAGVTP